MIEVVFVYVMPLAALVLAYIFWAKPKTAQRKKAAEYIQHNVKLSILVFPGECIEVYRPGRDVLVLSGDDILDGEDVLPDFKIPVKELI